MEEVLKTYNSLDSKSLADGFKHRVMQIFHAWEEWDIYPKEFLLRCQNTFLGLSTNEVNSMQILNMYYLIYLLFKNFRYLKNQYVLVKN